jgi:ATP-dependent RNA helicase DDX56/DBP9
LKRVPDYLLPSSGKVKDVGYVGIRKTSENRIRKARKKKGKPKRDPLSFKKR